MQSCLYRGRVRHQRPSPKHQFEYSTCWAYLDLSEIDQLIRDSWVLSRHRFAPVSFGRSDHFGSPELSLVDAVRGLVKEKSEIEFNGAVRVLTQFRHFGVYFSPVNVFYCFDDSDHLVALVAEVSNTPWNERHCYVLWEGNRLPGSTDRYTHAKEFHVSPFMGMDSQYDWRIQPPSSQLHLSLGCVRQGTRIFQADLQLRRNEISDAQLIRSLLRRPVAAAHVIGAIYYQAFRLWMKKCPFYPHPPTLPKITSENRTKVAAK